MIDATLVIESPDETIVIAGEDATLIIGEAWVDVLVPSESETLGDLTNVDDSADSAPTGKVLGTTGTGVWGPVDPSGGGGGVSESLAIAYAIALGG